MHEVEKKKSEKVAKIFLFVSSSHKLNVGDLLAPGLQREISEEEGVLTTACKIK